MPEDYLMRMVRQISAMLAGVKATRKIGHIQEAKRDLNSICISNIGLTIDTVKLLAPDTLYSHLRELSGMEYFRSVMLAEIFIQEAGLLEDEGKVPQAFPCYLHAFCLLSDSLSALSSEEQINYRGTLDMLILKLNNFPSNPYVTEKINAYRTHKIT